MTHPPQLPHPDLVAIVLTMDEAPEIAACVRSLAAWCPRILVLDSGSRDGTVAIARAMGAGVCTRPFDDYASQRQAALDMVAAEWVLFVDADERVPRALGEEILAVVRDGCHEDDLAAARIPRSNIIMEHAMQAGGFHPDFQIRLLRRGRVSYQEAARVHEEARVDGRVVSLAEPLLHYNYASWQEFHGRQRTYARLAALDTEPAPGLPLLRILSRGWHTFRWRFVHLEGWRDGPLGLWLALWLAWYYGCLPVLLALLRPAREAPSG